MPTGHYALAGRGFGFTGGCIVKVIGDVAGNVCLNPKRKFITAMVQPRSNDDEHDHHQGRYGDLLQGLGA